MLFSIRDTLMVTAMCALHVTMIRHVYPDLGLALATDPVWVIPALSIACVATWWLGRVGRIAGQAIFSAPLANWWLLPWLGFAVLHLDLVLTFFGVSHPLRIGTLRQVGLVAVVCICRQLSTVTIYEKGIGVQNQLLPWQDLWSRLQKIGGKWYLVLDHTIDGHPLDSMFAVPDPVTTLDILREVRGRAILEDDRPRELAEQPKGSL